MLAKDPKTIREEFTEKVLSHDYSKGPLLILAGPGTGKTHSLLETIRVQIQNGIKLSDFFVTTLTNAAAGDFEKDAKAKLSTDFENVSTLHFRAKGIVHLYADRVGLSRSFLVLTELEKDCVLKEIQQNLSTLKKVKAKDVDILLKKYEEEVANNNTITLNAFVLAYQELKKFYNVIDWYDVPYFACKILTENPDLLEKEASKHSFILVDEYQDLNKADQGLIKLISKNSCLLVVGDDDQSIYSGRFADPSGIVNFQSFYSGASEIKLPVCSRCPTSIIKASHNLINKNDPKKRVVKPLLIALPDTDKNANGGYVASVGFKSAKEEAAFLAAAIKTIIKDDPARAGEIMVLCSSRPIGLELMERIKKNHPTIPIEDKLTKEVKEESHIIVNYLKRFLDKNTDNLALRMFLCKFFNITAKAYAVIFDVSKGAGNLWEGLQKAISRKELKKISKILERFISSVNSTENMSIEDKLDVFSKEYPELKTTIEQIITPQKTIEELQKEDEQRLVKPTTPKGVQFMTMHNSKGLDANFIFVPFMEDELRLPARDIEEQRRLLYVAITRAKVSMVFSWAFSRRSASRHKAGGGDFMSRSLSNFIKDCGIGKDLPPQDVIDGLSNIAKISK